MKFIYVGDSNWNLYYDEQLKCIRSIAKQEAKKQGCKDTIFGSLDYTRRYLINEIKKDERKETRLTANGFKVLEGIKIL